MSDEELQDLTGEETPATEAEATEAEAATAETLPEGEDEGEEPRKPSKGVQKRFGELVKEREEWKRLAMNLASQGPQRPTQPPPAPAQAQVAPAPRQEDYETYEEYLDARTEWRADKKLAEYQASQAMQMMAQKREAWLGQGESKYGDFREMVSNPNLSITEVMRESLFESDLGPEMAYYLAKNPKEALRIANLPPLRQALEMGRLETKLTDTKPKPRTTTAAPSPTSPTGGKETPAKKPEDMTYDEYRAWREAGGGR